MEESINQNPEAMEALISNLFGNISSLKSAYIELQSAHTPYDPEKIQAADKVVISELKNLSEMKHFYRENNPKPVCVSPQDSRLAAEIQEQQSLLKTYEVMVKRSLMEQSLDAYDEKEKEMMMMIGSINRTELLSVLKAKGTNIDKLRFAIMYLISLESVNQTEVEAVEAALREAKIDTSTFQYVKKIKSLNVSLAANSASKSHIALWPVYKRGDRAGVKNLLSSDEKLAVARAVEC
ncbi:Sec1/munc18-like (SM) proteins superfamily [Arabidopsis thaliana]|uniref:Sec1/munc18-like (SM) proteins superfamily n=1 Tax=Arabidopsis thaliana TaxID=3702 RepID=F4JPL6_ARATH|nr:Sec1/munc18-like (SM) proteins superfamily [Arabidopsis thaliana]AEE86618.1 Sec1/munc18-like (SM) proteins superfamily [Arabidopsis thaliana]|eukprot:NP_567996.1 Sec1/munc18-like (SM) proteins superfamily [Arabidopsis thaliana]